MADLDNLTDALRSVRRRCAIQRFLAELMRPARVVLLALLTAALLSATILWSIAAAGLLSLGFAAFVLVRVLRRPGSCGDSIDRALDPALDRSLYKAAIDLDGAARLKDRLSTAYCFSHIAHPEGLLRLQRDDALRHFSHINPRNLFPITAPAGSRHLAVLLAAVAALLAYRAYFGPPLPSAARRTAETRLVKAMLSPIVHAMDSTRRVATQQEQLALTGEGEPRQAGAGAGQKGDGAGAEADGRARPGSQKNPSGAESNSTAQDREQASGEDKDGAGADDQQQADHGEASAADQQAGGQDGSGQQRSPGQRDRNGSGKDGASQNQQDGQSGSDSADGHNQSLASKVMQALKNMFSGSSSTPRAPSRGQTGQNPSQSPPQNGSQSASAGNQSPQGGTSNDRSGESSSQSPSGAQQPGQQKAGSGVGQQPGTDNAHNNEQLAGSLTPERVSLPAQAFTGDAQVRARPGDGSVKSPARNAAAPSAGRPNGAEQENVPLRYRLYVRRYFDQKAKSEK